MAAGLAACGTGDTPGPQVTSSPASRPAVTVQAQESAQQQAVAAYKGMWAAFVAAGKIPDPDAPEIRKYASDQALRLIVNALYTDQQQKKVIRGEVTVDPQVTALSPADKPVTVTISDCVNSEKWLVYKASGGLADDTPSGKHQTTATVKRTAEGWKVSSFILKEAGTC
jgi:hypothetical protein